MRIFGIVVECGLDLGGGLGFDFVAQDVESPGLQVAAAGGVAGRFEDAGEGCGGGGTSGVEVAAGEAGAEEGVYCCGACVVMRIFGVLRFFVVV